MQQPGETNFDKKITPRGGQFDGGGKGCAMGVYETFRHLDIDTAPLGLERGDTNGGYFCDPVGAEVIGWAGVDGIHCCFVKGFGDMVFSVSPMNPPGHYVHPLARSFEDFLRLVLACGGVDAIEQAWMWNRGEFDAFLEAYPPNSEQQAVLDTLRDKLALTPMDDPYGYIREVQYGFDYSKIPYPEEYYELVPEEPVTQGPPEKPEWRVYFNDGFSSRHFGHDKPGQEIPVNKTFTWGGKVWHIPAVYACGKGLVIDLCVEIDPAELRAFIEKWEGTLDRGLTQEEQEQMDAENPMTVDYDPKVTVNGRELGDRSGRGSGWTPMYLRPEDCRGEYSQQDWENIWLMEHYGLDPEKGWMFWRDSFPWATKTKPAVKTVSLSLEQLPAAVPGPRFTVSGAGDTVAFTHPVTGEPHTLYVAEYEQQEMGAEHLARMGDGEWEYPAHYTAMAYAVWPELQKGDLTVQDCGEGDRPRRKAPPAPNEFTPVGTAAISLGVIGGADGPTAILLTGGKSAGRRAACSSLYFQPEGNIQWRMVFYHKAVEDIEVGLLPPCQGGAVWDKPLG